MLVSLKAQLKLILFLEKLEVLTQTLEETMSRPKITESVENSNIKT